MKISAAYGRLRESFLEIPLPDLVLQVTPRYLSGLRISTREKKACGHFLSLLPEGAVRTSFDKPNLADAAALESAVRAGMKTVGLSQGTAALLVPELCAKIFVFELDAIPVSARERETIIHWRIGKVLPSLPEDARFAFRRSPYGDGERILAAVARASIVQEYESLLLKCGLAAGHVAPPFLSLIGILPSAPEENTLAINLEEDSLSLAARFGSDIGLYRQKPFSPDSSTPGAGPGSRLRGLLTEIENTVHYLEDREKRVLSSLWVRSGILGAEGDLAGELEKAQPLPVREAGSLVAIEAAAREKDLLAPLFGYLA